MKKVLLLSLSMLMACALLPGMAGAETHHLTYSSFFPPTHVQSQLAESWCKEVELRTNGRVTVDYYPGGTLTSAKECYDGVVQGMSDIGFSVLAYSRGRFPVMAAVDLPLGYPSGKAATAVANAVFKKFNPAAFDDVQVMYFHAHGPGLLHTADTPVRTLEDIKGLKLRATGNSAKLVQALGGTPVAGSMPDAYQAIQKGVVDGGMYPMETNKGWNMAEVVDYMTESFNVAYTTTFFVVMNKDRWNEMPADIRTVISAINAQWAGKHGQAWDESDVAGKEFFLEKGGQIIALDGGEAERWKSAAQPMLDAYVEDVTAKGLPGQEILDFTVQSLERAR